MRILTEGSMSATAGSAVIADLEKRGLLVSPHAFEVWHTYLTGADSALRVAIEGLLASGKLNDAAIEDVYDTHIRDARSLRLAERTSRSIMLEIDGLVELVRMSLGTSSRYGETLTNLLSDMVATNDPQALGEIVTALVEATEEARTANETLEKRLQAARQEAQELRQILESTRLETLKDALTGIGNRRALEQALTAALDQRRATRNALSLIMVDIDHFKQFNDRHGHLVGDRVLKVVAEALRDRFSQGATVARYGGEEFAILIENADLMAGWVAAEGARQVVMGRELVKRSTGEKLGRITISAGVACWRRGDSITTLMARADAALLRAKSFGRNRTITEDQMAADAVA
jgi:diguanylate cyclase